MGDIKANEESETFATGRNDIVDAFANLFHAIAAGISPLWDGIKKIILNAGYVNTQKSNAAKRKIELIRSIERIKKIQEYENKNNNYRRLHGCPARRFRHGRYKES